MDTFHNEKKITLQKGEKPYKCNKCDYKTDRMDHVKRHNALLHEGKKLFQCKMCTYRSSQKELLFRHIASIHDVEETLFKCPICNSEFAKEQDFLKHVSMVHERKSQIKIPIVDNYSSRINSSKSNSSMENEKPLYCKSCELKFINTSSLIQHIEKNHLKNPTILTNQQISADQKTKNKESKEPEIILLVHKKHKNITSKQEQEVFNCSICKSTFTQNSALAKHIELVHLKSFEIFLTKVDFHHSQMVNFGTNKNLPHQQTDETGSNGESFEDMKNKKLRIKSESNVSVKEKMGLLGCNICNSFYVNAQILKQHVESVHEGKKSFYCKICNIAFARRGNLKDHVAAVHDKLTPFRCSICDSTFAQKSNLDKHVAIVHKENKPYKCEICGGNFLIKSTLSFHISSVHEGKKPKKKTFQCTICTKKYATKKYLDVHTTAMHEENKKKKLIKCDTCYKYFTRKNNMKVHKKLNCKGGGANNSCEVSINHKGAVKRHMFIHEGKKPFQCTHCGNSFKRRNHLNSHMLSFHIDKKKIKHRKLQRKRENSVKTEETSIQCIICAKCFENKAQLKIHIESNHKKGK